MLRTLLFTVLLMNSFWIQAQFTEIFRTKITHEFTSSKWYKNDRVLMGQNHEVHLAINKNDVSSINNVGLSVGGAIYIKKDGNGSTLFQREFINASGPFDIVITDQNETYLTLNYWVAIVLDGDTILKDSSQFAGNSMALIKLKENGDLIFAKTLISSVNSGSPEYSFARNRRMLLNSKNELLITTRDFQGVSFPDTSITCNGSNIGRYPIVFYDTNGNRLRFTILGDCGSLIDLGSISDIIYTDNSEVVIAFSGYLDSARIQNNSFGPVGGVRIVKIDASGNYVWGKTIGATPSGVGQPIHFNLTLWNNQVVASGTSYRELTLNGQTIANPDRKAIGFIESLDLNNGNSNWTWVDSRTKKLLSLYGASIVNDSLIVRGAFNGTIPFKNQILSTPYESRNDFWSGFEMALDKSGDVVYMKSLNKLHHENIVSATYKDGRWLNESTVRNSSGSTEVSMSWENDTMNSKGSLEFYSVSETSWPTEEEVTYPPLSVNNENGEQFLTYPNPCKSIIYLENPHITNYTVYQIDGKMVLEGELSNQQIKVHDLNPGTYILELSKTDQFNHRQIIIKE